MNPQIKRILLFIVAFMFIVAGLLGLALPFLQGILFLAIGLILLSIASPRARGWIENYTRKYPKFHAWVEKIEKRITNIIGIP
ncbi:MAG TPA: hypothetical protein VI483_00705 [Candidatus Paceibacterota bacterium]